MHRKPPVYHHNIGTPIEGKETAGLPEFVIGNGDVIGSLDEAPTIRADFTEDAAERWGLTLRIAEVGLKFAEENDPKSHCQCKVCQEFCERCKELADGQG